VNPNDPQTSRPWHLPLLRLFFLAAALLLVGTPLRAKERPSEMFYYLVVPICQGEDSLVTISIQQFDRHGIPVLPQKKKGAKPSPFFMIWRSAYWEEKAPELPIRNQEEWRRFLDVRARQAVETKKEIAVLPPPIVQFFAAVETLRESARDREIIVQPLFQTMASVGSEYEARWNLLATPSILSAKERSTTMLRALHASKGEEEQDPAQWMKTHLINLGVKLQSVHYWPEYNVFLFEADGQFKDLVDVLFNSIGMNQSPLPRGSFYAMIAPHREP
jgi:hypothetical protein